MTDKQKRLIEDRLNVYSLMDREHDPENKQWQAMIVATLATINELGFIAQQSMGGKWHVLPSDANVR